MLVPAAGNDRGVRAIVGVSDDKDIWSWGAAAAALPDGTYRLDPQPKAKTAENAAIGWALGVYEFTRYRMPKRKCPRLVWPARADKKAIERATSATYLVRDLINTPANDMGPAELATAARRLGREFKARCRVTIGDALLSSNCPAIHAVGRASTRAPRLIDLTWGSNRHPKVTLVGKGVCFDTGGLDLKPAAGMRLMKKDMGGGAHALGLARMIMMAKLPLRLRVLVPAVENSVAGNAYRPFDVIKTRKGLTVEIGNTDAEGRIVLADALAMAVEEKPELILDFATLTGAARVAVGTEIAAMFCNDDKLAEQFARHAELEDDPVWRMPLWKPYRRLLNGKVADLKQCVRWTFRRRHNRCAVSRHLCRQRRALGSFRYHGLESGDASRSAGGRRGDGDASCVRGYRCPLSKALIPEVPVHETFGHFAGLDTGDVCSDRPRRAGGVGAA